MTVMFPKNDPFTDRKEFFFFICLTSTMALRAVSAPILRSVPGTLLLMVAGSIQSGMQNSS